MGIPSRVRTREPERLGPGAALGYRQRVCGPRPGRTGSLSRDCLRSCSRRVIPFPSRVSCQIARVLLGPACVRFLFVHLSRQHNRSVFLYSRNPAQGRTGLQLTKRERSPIRGRPSYVLDMSFSVPSSLEGNLARCCRRWSVAFLVLILYSLFVFNLNSIQRLDAEQTRKQQKRYKNSNGAVESHSE